MKTKTTVIAALAAVLLAPLSHADLLTTRTKLESAKLQAEAAASANPTKATLANDAKAKAQALTDFDTATAIKFGNWRERWQNSLYENPDDEAGDIYISGQIFNPGPPAPVTLSIPKQREVLAYIATKPKLVKEDLAFVTSSPIYNPQIAARLDELAALLPSKGIRDEAYFSFKHFAVLKKSKSGPGGNVFSRHMTIAEWFDLASAKAHFAPSTFHAMRNAIIATTAHLLINKRRAEGLPVEGPEFDSAFAPVLDAVKAPKFQGLAEAVNALGIDLAIPTPDYSAQEAIAGVVADAASRDATFWGVHDTLHKFQEGLGSVMFIMGESAYRDWREALLQPR